MKQVRTDSDAAYRAFLDIVERWTWAGERTTKWGARLICPTPHVAPEVWLHALYRGLTKEELDSLQSRLRLPMPPELRDFLLRTNGAKLFGSSVHVWGLRFSYARTGDEAWQPFDLVLHSEQSERPAARPPSVLMFGSCDEGEYRVFFDTADPSGRVGRTRRDKFAPQKFWPDFWAWLLDETRRLADRYDETGRLIRSPRPRRS